MKRYYLIVMAILVLTSGCTMEIQAPTAPAFLGELSATMTQASIEIAMPATFTQTATTTSGAFSTNDREVIFQDDFVESLGEGWEWVN